MKKRLFVASFAVLALAGPATAADIVVTAANLGDYTGAASIAISAGDTLHFSGITSEFALSASISGGGTLLIDNCTSTATLSGDNSSFSGTLLVSNSTQVVVGHVHALGSAVVSIFTDWAVRRTFLYSVTGEFPNKISAGNNSIINGSSPFHYSVDTGCTVTNSGAVHFSIPEYNKSYSNRRVEFGTTASGQKGRLVFSGSLNKSSKGYIYLYAPVTLAASLTSYGLNGGNSFFFNQNCDAILEKDVSGFFSGSVQAAKGTLRFAAEDCLLTATLAMGTSSSPTETLDLDGYDQHIRTITSPYGGTPKNTAQQYTSSAPATLTVTRNFSSDGKSSQGWARLDGHLSFAFDSDGASGAYCGLNTYSTYDNGTDGSITALNGTIHLGNTMRFTALSSLVMTNNGSIALATGSFPVTCDVYLSGTGKLILSNGVSLSVNRVFYKDGDSFVQANAGDYTAGVEGLAAYLYGEGTLSVLTSPPVTGVNYHWTSTGDTSLTPAANWQENASPDLANGTAYLHFNAGTPAADAADDILVYGLDFTRGTDFAFGGAGNTVSVGLGGVTIANTDGEAAHAVTVAPKLNVAELSPWIVGGNSSLTLVGGISSEASGAALTISGGETAASGNSVTFAGDSSASAMSVEVTNVERVVVASNTALPAQGLVMYDKLPDISSISSNAAPLEIRDIAHTFSDKSEVFWSNGVFRQTGLLTLRSRTHRAQINITGGEVQFLGGLECVGARHGFWLYGDAKMRVAGTIKDCVSDIDFRGRTSGSMNEVRSTAKTTSQLHTMYIGRVTFICEAENVLPYGSGNSGTPSLGLGIQSDYGLESVYAKLDLNGYDQQVNAMTMPSYESMDLIDGAHAVITSAVPATLTLKRGLSKPLNSKFAGAVNFTYDGGASAVTTFTLTNVVSDTTGELLVKSGTLVLTYGAGWGGSSNVTVAAGATLGVTDTGAATAFAPVGGDAARSIVNLKLEADGESYGKLDLGGNVSVKTLRIGDTFLPAGDYGSTASGVRNANDNHFTGTGILHVRRSGLITPLHLMIR